MTSKLVPDRRLLEAFRKAAPHGHVCPVYESLEDQTSIAAAFIQVGFERGERCLYVADSNTAGEVLDAARSMGVAIDDALRSGRLILATPRETYLRDDRFACERVLEHWVERVREAKRDGYTGLRLLGDMTWQLHGDPGSERLIEYEVMLNELLRNHDACALCQYDKRRFGAGLLLDLIRVHPVVVYGSIVVHNPCCIPPKEFLAADRHQREVQLLLEHLVEWERRNSRISHQANVLANVSDAVIAIDPALAITAWNRAAEAIYGWKESEVLGRPVEEVIPTTFVNMTRDQAAAAAAAGVEVELELVQQRKDGTRVWVESRTISIMGEAGEIAGYASVNRDITARKNAESEREKARFLLQERVKELTALHRVGEMLQAEHRATSDLLREVASVLPAAWQFPEIAASQISYGSLVSGTPGFARTPWILSSEFRTSDGEVGAVELCYVSGPPVGGEDGPFLEEEEKLIETVARMLRNHLDRRLAEARVQRQLEQLAALHRIDKAITASLHRSLTLDIFLEEAAAQLGADAAGLLLLETRTLNLNYAAGRGFAAKPFPTAQVRLGQGTAGKAALEQVLVAIPDVNAATAPSQLPTFLAAEGFKAYHATPLVAKGDVKGVLEIFHRSPYHPGREWLDFLEMLAGQAAIAIQDFELLEGLKRSNLELTLAYETTLEGWVQALDLRDKETEGHTQRVTELTVRVARKMGIHEDEIVQIRRGALLHDIGKLGIPDAVLLKPGALTEEEWQIMRKHPTYAYEWLAPIAYLRPCLDIPYCHHEKWDGTGYPRGLRAEAIPQSARIFAIVDVWDALRSDRPYRKAWSEDKVRDHVRSLAGTDFDPRVVDAFLAAIEPGG